MVVIDDTLSYDIKADHIHFILKGDRNYEIALSWWNDIAGIANRLKSNKILVEALVFGELTSLEILNLVNEFEFIGLRGIKVALVERNLDQKYLDEYKLMIANLPEIDAHIFIDKEDALEWLKHEVKEDYHHSI